MSLLSSPDLARALQDAVPWLQTVMRFFTFLGTEEFCLVLMPLILWCISKPIGIDMGLLLLFSSGLNGWTKGLLRQPRPYWIDPSAGLDTEVSFGLPSGHAMNALSLWGYLALAVRARRPRSAWPRLAVVLILCISFSRIYLGVHYLTDVLGGWLLAAPLLWAYLRLKPRAAPWLGRQPWRVHLALACVAAAAVLVSYLLAASALLPSGLSYADLARDALEDARQSGASTAGMLLGAWVALVGEARTVRYRVDGQLWQRALRYVLGMLGLLAIWGLRAVFPADPLAVGLALRVLRYALMMLWTLWIWPALFVRLGLGAGEFIRPLRSGAVPA